jgi:quercetin dioxygenase-like cupin family protein
VISGSEAVVPVVIAREKLRDGQHSTSFEGFTFGDVNVSPIMFEGPPGSGPRLHRHPYAEVFIMLEGQASFTVGDTVIDATVDQIVIALPGEPHKFVNSGSGLLRQIDIHCSSRFITEWLEPECS